jgi:hypothetical protein
MWHFPSKYPPLNATDVLGLSKSCTKHLSLIYKAVAFLLAVMFFLIFLMSQNILPLRAVFNLGNKKSQLECIQVNKMGGIGTTPQFSKKCFTVLAE